MKETYLIQRLKQPLPKPKNEKAKFLQDFGSSLAFGGGLVNGGIPKEGMKLLRDIFRFDYMGSSEFEWGVVPEALARIVDEIKNYVGDLIGFIRGLNVWYFCHKDHEEEVINRIRQLATDEYKFRLKERCNLKEALEGKEYCAELCGWLELDNSFMFFTDREMFEKTAKLFGIS